MDKLWKGTFFVEKSTYLCSQLQKGLNEHSSLNCHVKTTSNSSTLQRFLRAIEPSHIHQSWHLRLC